MSAREFITNLVIGGRSVEGVRAIRGTREEIDRLRQQTQQAQGAARQFTSTFRGKNPVLRSVTRRVLALGAAYLSINSAVRSFNRLIEESDSIGKLATQTRFGVEALQEYRFAAQQSGVSNQQFDDSIQRLNRRLGLFVNNGGGPAAAAFKSLGIEVLEANGQVRQTEAVFEDIISILSQYDSEARMAARASEFFGDRTGPKMAQMIMQGTASIEELRAVARSTGSILGEDTVRSAEKLKDQMAVLQMRSRALSTEIFTGMVPALTSIIGSFEDSLKPSGELQEGMSDMEQIGLNLAVAIGRVAQAVLATGFAFDVAGKQLGSWAAQAMLVLDDLRPSRARDFVSAISGDLPAEEAERVIMGNRAALEQIRKETESDLADVADLWLGMFDKIGQGIDNAMSGSGDSIEKLGRRGTQSFEQLLEEMNKLRDEAPSLFDRFNESLAQQLESIRQQTIEFQSGRRALLMYQAAQAAAASGVNLNTTQIEAQVDELLRLEKALQDEKDAREEANQAREDYANAEDLIRSLQAEVLAIQGGADAYREYQREMFITQQIMQLGARATDEQRHAIRELAGELFDLTEQSRQARMEFASLGEAMAAGLEIGFMDALGQESFWGALFDGDLDTVGKMLGTAIGSALGAAIGAYFTSGSAWGVQIGAAIGGAVGGLLDNVKDPKFQLGSAQSFSQTGGRPRGDFGTAFGDILFRFRNIEDETQRALMSAMRDFDANLATVIGRVRLPAAMQALQSFAFDSADDGGSLEAVIEQRFNTVLTTFDGFTQNFVRSVDGFEQQFQRLIDVLAIQRELLLGGGLGLGSTDSTLTLVEELRRPVETVGESFLRLTTVTGLLDTAIALTGNTIGDTREDVIRFGDLLSEVFGDDLERLGQGISRIFSAFFSEDETLNVVADNARDRARALLESIGVEVTDELLSRGGFRDLFDAMFGTLSPEDLAILIEAGVAVADLVDAEDRLLQLRGQVADEAQRLAEVEDFLNGIRRQTLELVAPMWAEFDALNTSMADTWNEAQRLGLSEDQLARVRRLHQLQLERFIASLRESIADLNETLFGGGDDPFANMANSVDNSARQMRDSIIRGLEAVRTWLDSSLLDQFSTLTPQERLNEAGAQFRAAIAAVQAGDMSALNDLPGLADAFRREGASFFGTSTNAFGAIEDEVRAAMQGVAGLSPPQEVIQEQIAASTRNIELSAIEQLLLANDLVQQIALLAEITGKSPAEIGEEFGIPIAQLIQKITGELPDLTGDALSVYFNELVDDIQTEIQVLLDIEALEIAQLSVLQTMEEHLKRIADRDFENLPQFASGGPVNFTGPAGVHSGEFVVPNGGVLVSGNPAQERAMQLMAARLAGVEQQLQEANRQRGELIGVTGAGLSAVVKAEGETKRELERVTQPGSRRSKVMS